jgi:hypothetical protein
LGWDSHFVSTAEARVIVERLVIVVNAKIIDSALMSFFLKPGILEEYI